MDTIPSPPPLPVPDEPAGTSELVPVLHLVRKHRHVSVPLLVPVFALVGGLAARLLHAGRYVAVAGAMLAVLIWVFAPHRWDRPAEVTYARLSALAAAGWLSAVAFLGFSRATLIPLVLLSLAWGFPYWRHKRPRFSASEALGEWQAWWKHYAFHWQVGGSRITEVWTLGVQDILRIQLLRGHQTIQHIRASLPLIASALGGHVRPGMVRAEEDPDDPSQVLVYLKRENPLAAPVTWDETRVPSSILDPAPIAVREADGEWITGVLLCNLFAIGRSRSGKSNFESVLLASITACPDAIVWLIDRKGGRAARPWLPAVDWLAISIEEARLMLRTLAAEVRARAQDAYNGDEQLTPNPEVPAIFLFVDEAAEVTGMANGDSGCAASLASAASMGMGVAVYVVVFTQYGALAESVRSEQVRSNLPRRVCFAVTNPDHGAFALSNYTRLDASRLELPGSCYYQDGPKAETAPARTPEIPHALARQIAERNGALPRRPLVLFAQDQQETYDGRWARLPETFRPLAPQYAGYLRTRPAAAAAADPEVPVSAPATAPADDSPQALAAMIETECANTPAGPPPEVSSADLAAVMIARKRRFARTLAQAGPEGIKPAQLIVACGMSRSWVQHQLPPLLPSGVVIKVGEAAYRGTSEQAIWDEMEGVRLGNERMLASAAS